jgi:predicted enzyme related to lactoylglutathione lyase
MANGVTWFEVAGKDREALKGFYSQLFDWKLSDMEEMPYTGVEASDGGIPGGIGQAPEGHPGHVIFYVSVEDIDAALERIESLGGKRGMGPMEIPAGQIAHFSDPEGHVVGLWQQAAS